MSSRPLLTAVAPLADPARERGASRGRARLGRIMPGRDVALSGLAIFAGAFLLATLAVFLVAVGLTGVIAAIRWVLATTTGAPQSHGIGALRPLLEVSVGSGLILAMVASLAFLADLRRQHWL